MLITFACFDFSDSFAQENSQIDLYQRTFSAITGILDDRYSYYFRVKAILVSCGESDLAGQINEKATSHLTDLDLKILPTLLQSDREALVFFAELSEVERSRMIDAVRRVFLVYGIGFDGGYSTAWSIVGETASNQDVRDACSVALQAGREITAADDGL